MEVGEVEVEVVVRRDAWAMFDGGEDESEDSWVGSEIDWK